ncbi:MAG: hypothetical protein ACE5F1_11905 [Planctomycetota bacterium]
MSTPTIFMPATLASSANPRKARTHATPSAVRATAPHPFFHASAPRTVGGVAPGSWRMSSRCQTQARLSSQSRTSTSPRLLLGLWPAAGMQRKRVPAA